MSRGEGSHCDHGRDRRPLVSIAETQPPTQTGFAKIVPPVFHARDFLAFLLHTAMTK